MADDLDEKVASKFGHMMPQKFETNENNKIKHIIGVVSGKGGVGKSMVTSLLAVNLRKNGYNVGILDYDITGPSIPKSFGLPNEVNGTDSMMFPQVSKTGIEAMSINLLLDDETQPVLWRGSMVRSAMEQFYKDTYWGELDYLLIDMPPGTSDIALNVFQSVPLDGIIIVSSPQDLVKMIVGKAVNMANQMKINIIGLVENMSYMVCPCCGEKIYPFGESKLESVAKFYNIKPLKSFPINPKYAELVDKGLVEDVDTSFMDDVRKEIEKL